MATDMGEILSRLATLAGLEEKRFAVEAPSRRGAFTGYAAVYGNTDRHGEVVDRGAFDKCLSATKEFPLLWSHKPEVPVGVVRAQSDARGLKVLGQLTLDVENARECYALMLTPDGFDRPPLREMSIGYIVRDEEYRGGARHLKEVEVHEVSLVTLAANPLATVLDVKEAGDDEIDTEDYMALVDLVDYMKADLVNYPFRRLRLELDAIAEVIAESRPLHWSWRGAL